MNQGTFFSVIEFPLPWPLSNETNILSTKSNTDKIDIFACEDGSLKVMIEDETFKTEKIIIRDRIQIVLIVVWNCSLEEKIEVFINERKLRKFNSESHYEIIKNSTKIESKEDSKKDKIKACETWMKWRKHHLSNKFKTPQSQRELKSLEEQLLELRNSIEILVEMRELYPNYDNKLLISILPILRALLFWQDKKGKSNYNPLLFRVAAFKNLPLPVYAYKDRIKSAQDNEIFKSFETHKVFNFPSITKNNNESLMDFQEWLSMDFLSDRIKNNNSIFNWKDLIHDAANTLGSHFDQDKYTYISMLQETYFFQQNNFVECIKAISNITITLGDYVLNEE